MQEYGSVSRPGSTYLTMVEIAAPQPSAKLRACAWWRPDTDTRPNARAQTIRIVAKATAKGLSFR